MAEHPIVVTVSTGRCGTYFLCATFQENFGDQARTTHELLGPHVAKPATYHRCFEERRQEDMRAERGISDLIDCWRDDALQGPVIDFGFTMAALAPLLYREFGNRFRVLLLHRDPIEVAASFAVRGHYSRNKSRNWAITPSHEGARFKQFESRWEAMSPFERCLYRWLEITAYGLELQHVYPGLKCLTVKSEKLYSSDESLRQIAEFCGIETVGEIRRAGRTNAKQIHHVESSPIGSEWRNFVRHPEVIQLAEQLGYDMREEVVAKRVSPYQLPAGVGARIRHHTRYWQIRFQLGKVRHRGEGGSRRE